MKLFAIVGMHRSGTSIVSRIANLLGASLGPTADLMPPKPDNPSGFWESLSVTQLHDDLLGALGGPWSRPPVLPSGWEDDPRLAPFVERLERLVETHFCSAPLAVWKDPRGSLLLPLWRRVTAISGTVVCVRDPRDVARSLLRRDGLDPEHVAGLWLTYTLGALGNDPTCLVVPFEDAHGEPGAVARRLAAFLGEPPPSPEALAAVDAFVVPDRRAAAATPDDASGDGPALRLALGVHRLVTSTPVEQRAPLVATIERGLSARRADLRAPRAPRAPRGQEEAPSVPVPLPPPSGAQES